MIRDQASAVGLMADCLWLSAFLKGGSPVEPRKDEEKNASESRPEGRKKRFRLVKLEERIAPQGKQFTDPSYLCGVAHPGHTANCTW